jgi:hypothetical protein
MSKYAPPATSNASQFVDILLRGLAGRRAGPVLIHFQEPVELPARRPNPHQRARQSQQRHLPALPGRPHRGETIDPTPKL